jgi:putative exporter of polyketide antibiotics
MYEIALIAYILSLISIAVSLYVLLEIRELKKENRRKLIEKRLNHIVKSVNIQKPKGFWDK